MVKFDGKHWIAKRARDGPFLYHSYGHVANVARRNLGEKGIVAIPNARPDEFRYEEFIDSGRRLYNLQDIDEGKAVYDPIHEIYFMKAQEINTHLRNQPITFLAYNLPFNSNLRDKDGETVLIDAFTHNSILGLTLPSCIGSLEAVLNQHPQLLRHLDFV